MEKIYIFCPSSQTDYLRLLEEVSPRLDHAGISFRICRPGEDIAGRILDDWEVRG